MPKQQFQSWEGGLVDLDLLQPGLLHELFEAQAAAHPERTALVCGDRELTYGALDAQANQVAHWLIAAGTGPGSCVGLLLPRSLDIFVALLGILKAGAAYVPIDAGYPADRVEYILSDCHAQALVTVDALKHLAGSFSGKRLCLDAAENPLKSLPRSKPEGINLQPRELAYIIYTSGTSGRPKGVQIEHRSACHLVRAEGKIFGVRSDDRVYQGFSVAFDASVEEIWLAFYSGATLVVGTQEMVHAGPLLAQLLTQARVTVFSCVPTLLSMMEGELPTVRLLILGGEQCPPDLVRRWHQPGRRMVNTYGPTEATVIATFGDCAPGRPVTIGRPVPNYRTHVLDEKLQPVASGTPGELHIGGIGLARGYVGRPDLTEQKFVPNPFASDAVDCPRLYKTGDLVRVTPDGEIEFLGRIDTQVKLRGFRVELSEIEAVLLQCPGVLAAAVTVREETPGVQQLVGYAVPRDGATLDEDDLRHQLRASLPAYMVPALVELLAALPTLPSGKVDRRQLPAPKPRASTSQKKAATPTNEIQRKLLASWQALFAPAAVSLQDDFFLDLGGHSLLAARMVSELRKDPQLQELSILDVYQHPTIEKLALKLQGAATAQAAKTTEQDKPHRASFLAHFWCGLMQFVGLYFSLGFFSLQWLAPYLTYTWMVEDDYERYEAVLGALGVLTALYPAMLLASIVVKWIVVGRYKPGKYPLWGFYYFRWWFVNTIQSAIPVGYLAGTPLLNIYYRLMGAKIGANVHLATDNCAMFDLISIGDDTSIGTDASLMGYTVEDGWLKLGRIDVGQRCYIGTRSVLRENTRMEDGARLEDLSLLTRGSTIPAGETWLGSPASCIAKAPPAPARSVMRPSRLKRIAYGLLHTLGVLVFPVVVLAAIFPGMMLMNYLNYEDDYYWYLMLSPLVAITFVVLLCLEIAAVKWLLLGRVKAGRYPLYSSFYFRKWFVDQLMELSLDFLGPLYASIYLAPWYRLLGAKLGNRAEISTASFISPDLLAIDDESFIADSVSLGAARVENNELTVAGNRIGKRSFIGNSAMLPPGAIIGDNCLIGCLSTPPASAADALRPDATWLGSPAIFLPQRQASTAFSDESTFKPTLSLRMQRAAIEFLRVILPSTGFVILTSLLFSVVVLIQEDIYLEEMLLLFPLLYAGCGLIAALFTIAMKWILMGRYRAGERPLWSTFVWRTELVNALQEHLANDFIISMLTGTPFISWYYRLLGAKIGRRVYMETTDLTEFDLVKIGDEASLNADCTIQTHLFEDRVMKMATVEIGPRVNVGCLALVLYDTRMEEGASINDLSLLMKGETLPAGTAWEGIPARPKATTIK